MLERKAFVVRCGIVEDRGLPARMVSPVDLPAFGQRASHLHHALDAGQAGQQLVHYGAPVMVLALVAVAVDGEQHFAVWRRRSSTTEAPMSGAQLDQTAPMLAQARKAISVSGRFGM